MKQLSKLMLITCQLSLCAFGADGAGEKPLTPQTAKAALSITALTMKSADGRLEMKLEENGRILVNGEHVATANAKGEFNSRDGKLLMRIKDSGEVEPDLFGAPIKVAKDGTLTGGGKTRSWVEGKFEAAPIEITPKDSPSKQAATVMFILSSVFRGVAEPK